MIEQMKILKVTLGTKEEELKKQKDKRIRAFLDPASAEMSD